MPGFVHAFRDFQATPEHVGYPNAIHTEGIVESVTEATKKKAFQNEFVIRVDGVS